MQKSQLFLRSQRDASRSRRNDGLTKTLEEHEYIDGRHLNTVWQEKNQWQEAVNDWQREGHNSQAETAAEPVCHRWVDKKLEGRKPSATASEPPAQ
jgi:hypothetical protein